MTSRESLVSPRSTFSVPTSKLQTKNNSSSHKQRDKKQKHFNFHKRSETRKTYKKRKLHKKQFVNKNADQEERKEGKSLP
jgi:hypothetical protein